MGAQPMVPAGRVTESLVIEATFGPLVLFHLLSQRDVQVTCSFYFFQNGGKENFLKSEKIFTFVKKKILLKGDAMQ